MLLHSKKIAVIVAVVALACQQKPKDQGGRATEQPATPGSAGENERQPVAGQSPSGAPAAQPGMPGEAQPGMPGEAQPGQHQMTAEKTVIVLDPQGKPWPVSDPAVARDIRTKLSAHGMKVKEGELPEAGLPAAISEFQRKNALPPTGQIDRKTAAALGLDYDKILGEAKMGMRGGMKGDEGVKHDKGMKNIEGGLPSKGPQ